MMGEAVNADRDAPGQPPFLRSVEEIDAALSEPTAGVVDTFRRLEGDLLVLGAAGKMGPTLAGMARRASLAAGIARRIIGVARFSEPAGQRALQAQGVETIPCDLLDETAVARLPDAANVIFMAGRKFGSTGEEPRTWAVNTHLPSVVCRRFPRSRIVVFSTGNVYGLTPVDAGGARETTPPRPVGEYAMSCLGRERLFDYFSRARDIPMAFLRLNYAAELRYGVLVDLAQAVFRGETIDLAMGHFNTLWQGDANAMALQTLGHVACPPFVVNLAGPELLSVRQVCEKFARLLARDVRFRGTESPTALLSNGQLGRRLFGPPRVGADQLISWIADWVKRGKPTLDKPTHFGCRDGAF
jgi:nucleoside-diphosphate-sugar epimerase